MPTTPSTIPALFRHTASARPDGAALGFIKGGQLEWKTWAALSAETALWEAGLAALGVGVGDRVVQISANCLEWVLADLAIQAVGGVHVPLHASLAPGQMAEQIAHSGARLAIVQDEAIARELAGRRDFSSRTVLHSDVAQAGAGAPAMAPRELDPDGLATILYTSGTTGAPHGVMLTQRNLAANAMAMTEIARRPPDEVRLGILPLSHIYARTCDLYTWLCHGSLLVLAESRETAFRDLRVARPTVISAVPYFYQKMVDHLRSEHTNPGSEDLRAAFGGEIRSCHCGGAPLAPEVDQFFADRGLPILCGYGLTEASPVISTTQPEYYAPGSVGRPLPNVEVRLADDGEVLARGESIMAGYWRNDEETRRVLRDGWLHTGDLGQWDDAGNLRIVGRKKEIIVLSTGKKVSPAAIEQLLVGSPLIEQACVVGDGQKFLAALIVPNAERLRREIKQRRLVVWSKRRATRHPEIVKLYREEIDRRLGGNSQCEQIGAFTVLIRGFEIARGECTLKLSLRRSVITENFSREIQAMYRAPGSRTTTPPSVVAADG